MRAMILAATAPIETNPLTLQETAAPQPQAGQIRVHVTACGVCHTELDEIEGRLEARLPVVPGHEVVGRVDALGPETSRFEPGDRVGIAWIFSACGRCSFCRGGNENLCAEFRGTGCDADGGYAEYMVVPEAFAYPIPEPFSDVEAAPLLCAGVVGYRALRLTGLADGQTLGFFGFGASAHILVQVARHKFPRSKVFVFTRPGQTQHQELARKLGAHWAGATGEDPPARLHAAIDTTPAWTPIVEAMRVLERGGRLVINAIRKEATDQNALLALRYPEHLWLEKEIKTVANVTRQDAREFLPLAAEVPIRPLVQEFVLEQANEALKLVKAGKTQGAAVLRISKPAS
ncbi:MAG: zinc-dependent alcohol dehydrogenase family protein [Sedimentisphaerales bacterium]|nr:zinc-dependent alcohol dehydrogenase family protein [Sedimentisphaerales bacterium]